MYSRKKTLFAIAFATIFAIAMAVCVGIFAPQTSSANAEAKNDYYYNQLSDEAKRFYNAIDDMESQGLLKQGNAKYDLIANDVLTTAQLESFSQSQNVLNTFGSARDAYYLDHPEIFYVDFTYLSISVGTKDGNFVATLGTGRSESYLVDGFTAKSQIDTAITAFNSAIDGIVAEANGQTTEADKVKSVNASLVEIVTYSFCTTIEEADCAPHIRNAYGALVNGKAVCEGFARSFKCVMDRLSIPCVIVHGYASDEGGIEPHAWNLVKLGESWYGVDTTWNASSVDHESYLLCGANVMDKEHIADGVISSANFKFNYPLPAPNNYGMTDEEIKVNIQSKDESTIIYEVSKDGMNSTQLAQKGLWLSNRYYYYDEYTGDMVWSQWVAINKVLTAMGMSDSDGYSLTSINASVMYVQFAVIKSESEPSIYGTFNSDEISFVCTSQYYENDEYSKSYGAPYVKATTPNHNSANLDATKTYDVEITYTQKLKKVNGNETIGINVTTLNKDTVKYSEITDVVWDGNDKVTFKFTPSAMYQHRDEAYTFTPVNLVGEQSDKTPMSVTYLTKNNNVACNRVYPDGRLYVNTYGQPSLVGSGDLSLNGWQDGNGNPVSENQRSQLMLVATKTTEKEGKEMIENAPNLPQNAVKSAETFEIELNLCKSIVKIPNGSTVQVAFGFPAGYGSEDEGVTFKVYHFKRGADGKIDYSQTEEVECIITEYGLMVNVSDFSPFAVVAVDKAQVPDVKKSVYARSVGFGGSFDGEVAQLVNSGGSVTYTLTPESGYKVAKVTLNGNDLAVNGNTVTLSYDQLDERNTVEFHYVAQSVADYEATNGITAVYSGEPTIADTPTDTPTTGGNGNPTNAVPIIVLVVGAVGVIALVAVVLIIIKRRRQAK